MDTTREQLAISCKEAIVEFPNFKKTIYEWLAESLKILKNKPRNPEEVKRAALAHRE